MANTDDEQMGFLQLLPQADDLPMDISYIEGGKDLLAALVARGLAEAVCAPDGRLRGCRTPRGDLFARGNMVSFDIFKIASFDGSTSYAPAWRCAPDERVVHIYNGRTVYAYALPEDTDQGAFERWVALTYGPVTCRWVPADECHSLSRSLDR